MRAISATGAVNPVVTVQVGSYVSGPIQEITCDFNTKVVAGQRCALIDPRPYQVALDQARANLAAAEAQLAKDRASLAYAQRVHESNRGLVEGGAVSRREADNEPEQLRTGARAGAPRRGRDRPAQGGARTPRR